MKTFKQLFESITSDTIDIDGTKRPRHNSEGNLIHPTEAGIRSFYKWFGNSRAVDSSGRPTVMYRGMNTEHSDTHGSRVTFVTPHKAYANDYASGDKSNASESPNVMKLYAKVENPIHLGFKSQHTHVKFSDVASRVKSRLLDDYRDGKLDEKSAKGAISHLDKGKAEYGDHMAPVWHFHNNSHHLHNAIKFAGYDAIHSHEGDTVFGTGSAKYETYGILHKNNLKSAISNNGNYSRSGTSGISETLLESGHISIHRGVKLFPTNHIDQRQIERHVPKENLLKIHRKVVDKIKSGEYTPKHGTFMVFDKEHKQTVLMQHRADKYATNDTRKHLFLISAYDPGDVGKPRQGQDRVVTEQYLEI